VVARTVAGARPVAARISFRREETFWAFIFLAPWLVGLVVFVLGPMLFSLGLSFFTYTLGRDSAFVGFDNWIRAFTKDEFFWPAVTKTAIYTVVLVPLSVFGALGTAMLLNQRLRFTTTYRTIFFMPHLVPIIAATYVWLWLLNGQYGVVNEAIFQLGYRLTGTGWKGPNWFGDTHLVDVHVSKLRRKLGDDAGESSQLQTVRGVGYRLDPGGAGAP